MIATFASRLVDEAGFGSEDLVMVLAVLETLEWAVPEETLTLVAADAARFVSEGGTSDGAARRVVHHLVDGHRRGWRIDVAEAPADRADREIADRKKAIEHLVGALETMTGQRVRLVPRDGGG